jgi:PPOX class probable F420-dependent enzyme
MKITIIGGGPAGLFFAILMKKQNPAHAITVLERDSPNDTFGWGVVLSARTVELLQEHDPATHAEFLRAAESWDYTGTVHQGETIKVRGSRFFGMRRLTLLQMLHQRARELGVAIRFNANVADGGALEQLAAQCDLLVGADGVNSIVRRAYSDFFLPITDLRQNKYVWLGTRQAFDCLTMIFRANDAGLFIAHAYQFDKATSTFIVECAPATWERAGFAQMNESATTAYLGEVFKDDLGGHLLMTNQFKWNSFSLLKNKRWHHRNIVLLGDALHTVHFSIGSGTKLALEDAVALARACAQDSNIATALPAFQKSRKPRVDQFQDAALASLSSLETIQTELHLEPIPFAYNLMTRSNRVGYKRLKRQAPEFIAQYEAWRGELPPAGKVPREFLDLFQKQSFGHLATMMPDGTPQVTSVWVDYDGEYILVNSAQGRQKDRNMETRRIVALEIPDPENPNRYLSIRGRVVEITKDGADDHLDKLAQRYLIREKYPPAWKFPGEVRRIYKIAPEHVIAWEPFG